MSEVSESQICITDALSALSTANRVLQRSEFKANHHEWISSVKADFGPGLLERLSEIRMETFENVESYNTSRIEFQAAMSALLHDYGVLAIPTVTAPPPVLQMNSFRLLCIAGLSGICQITMPLGMHENLPVSISLLAANGKDHFLLNLAQILYATLKEQAAVAWGLDI